MTYAQYTFSRIMEFMGHFFPGMVDAKGGKALYPISLRKTSCTVQGGGIRRKEGFFMFGSNWEKDEKH